MLQCLRMEPMYRGRRKRGHVDASVPKNEPMHRGRRKRGHVDASVP